MNVRNRRQTAVQTQNVLEGYLVYVLNVFTNVRVSERTLRRRLNKVSLKSYVPVKAPKFEISDRVARLAFAHRHRD